jgi:hypothetical protein
VDPLLGVLGAGDDLLRLRVDEVVLRALAALRPGLELLLELELVRGRDREAVLVARRVERVLVDVEEPELGGLADQLGGLVGVGDAQSWIGSGPPCCRISGSATPSASTRFRITSIARSRFSSVTSSPLADRS